MKLGILWIQKRVQYWHSQYLCGTEALIFSNLRLIFDSVAFIEEAMSVLKSLRMALVSLFNEFTFDSHSSISLCVT